MNKRRDSDVPRVLREADAALEPRVLEALIELVPPAKAPPQLLRDRLLATINRPRLRFAPLYGALGDLFDLPDADLAGIFERAASAAAWTQTGIPGTQLLHLTGGPRVAAADNGLVRIKSGARFPLHRHLGAERTLVLEGSYRDEPSGQPYRPGDWHEQPAGSSHAYTALPGSDLLLAVSVVSGVEVDGYGTLSAPAR